MTDEETPIGIQQSVNSLARSRLEVLVLALDGVMHVTSSLGDAHPSKPFARDALAALQGAVDHFPTPCPNAGFPTRDN